MLYLLPLAGLLQMCAGGGVYPLPPSTIVSTSEAHGPLARLALSSGRPQALQYYSQVTAPQAPVVVPQVTPLTGYSVPTYLAQPSYVQNLVATPTARLQVRRPAVQKQFYDIEQRTIIRPVGTAVLELVEPLSKTFVSPTAHHTDANYPNQLVYPVGNYPFGPYPPFQVPVQSYPPSFIQQPQYVSQRPVLPPQPPQQFPSYPQPPQQTQPQRPGASPVEAQPLPSRPGDLSDNSEFDSSDTVVIDNPDFARSAGRPRELAQREKETRSLSETRANDIQETSKQEQTVQKNEDQSDQDAQARNQQILNEFQSRQLIRMFLRQPTFNPPQPFQQILPLQINNQFRSVNLDDTKSLDRSQVFPSFEPINDESKLTSTDSTSTTSTTETVEEQTAEEVKENFKTETTSTTEKSSQNVSQLSLDTQESAQHLHRQYSSEQITSVRNLTPQEAQYNQQKLIELLTGQGEISEINLSRSGVKLSVVGDSGLVKGRVLSVTPAPLSDQLGDERVSTRRVVVSRPIQTLEEVDVHQPFTRVAVHGPALLKSVHPHFTRLSTSIPVLASTPATLVYH